MNVTFIADDFPPRAPVQQLLDRFLIGYPHEGEFKRPDCRVTLVVPQSNAELERRVKDFGLSVRASVGPADAALVFSRPARLPAVERCFVYGVLPPGAPKGVIAGTAVRGAWLLPGIVLPKGSSLNKALAIAQGPFPGAEIDALEALLPLIWERRAAGSEMQNVSRLAGDHFWAVLKRDFWPLVKAAVSRSDTPQGDPVRDGRTQDLVGLGLLEKLVKEPRGVLIEHADGFACALMNFDGAVADYNVALQTAAGGILSAQVYRPPAPAEHHYSRLAAILEQYFRTGTPPWPAEQNLYTAEILRRLKLR